MDKKQQIDEMEDIMSCSWNTKSAAAALYNAGYRKIDDDCAVITKDELKQYKMQAVKEFAERLKERMGERDYMGVKYKQGVFSENDIGELLKEREEWKTISNN